MLSANAKLKHVTTAPDAASKKMMTTSAKTRGVPVEGPLNAAAGAVEFATTRTAETATATPKATQPEHTGRECLADHDEDATKQCEKYA